MYKEFINYNQALKLKELGFDEECFGVYIAGQLMITNDSIYNSTDIPVIKVPTFSQAFRWFRENHKLQHHIWSGKLNHIFYGYDILNIEEQEFVMNNSDIGGGDCDYDTYEEAEQACLDKLIELTFKSE